VDSDNFHYAVVLRDWVAVPCDETRLKHDKSAAASMRRKMRGLMARTRQPVHRIMRKKSIIQQDQRRRVVAGAYFRAAP
jgi:hypothetical protein